MADDSLQGGSDTISTDHVSTLNGAPITPGATTPKVQRVKVSYGDDNTSRDVSPSFPLPVLDPDFTATGTISATDAVVGAPAGAGALVTGASTAGSIVSLLCPGGDTAWNVQLTGTFGGGTVYYEESLDSTNGTDGSWIAVNGRQTGVVNTVLANGTTVAGYFRGNTSGAKYFRLRMVGATTPSVAAIIRISSGTGAIFLNASIPAGTNTIGNVGVNGTVPVSIATNTPDVTDRAARLLGVLSTGANTIGNVGIVAGAAAIGTVGVTSLPAIPTGANTIGAVNIAASQTVAVTQATAANLNATATLAAGTNAVGHINELRGSTLVVTATAAAATAVTATLAAAGAGLFHYITSIRVERFITVATTASATILLTGGTNHALVFGLPNDVAGLGVQSVPVDFRPTTPLKVTAANTATTVTTPVVAGTVYRITVSYFTAV